MVKRALPALAAQDFYPRKPDQPLEFLGSWQGQFLYKTNAAAPFREQLTLPRWKAEGQGAVAVCVPADSTPAQANAQMQTTAVAELRARAEQGDAEAQFKLGLMYVNGQGVPQDYAQAVGWYRKAAEQGYAAAQYNLGRMYETGRGVPRDDVEAHLWQDLAAARATGADQKTFADGRDELAKSMTPAQVGEARRRAQAWTDASALRRTAPATQANAELEQPALQLADVTITPRAVGAGKPFSLAVAYTATDPAASSRKAAVTLSFSILSGGTSLLDVPGEIVESTSGQPWKVTKPLTATTTPGTYLIRVRLALGATVVTRDVEFEITR
jgi:hypothetical protein